MYAPYEDGMQLLNFSTFSTNVSLVEEADLERALASFDMPVLRPNDDAGNDNAGGVVDVQRASLTSHVWAPRAVRVHARLR